jgi:hypothetical protein
MLIEPKFNIGDIVYFVTDPEQREFLVIALIVELTCIRYRVGHSSITESECNCLELSKEKKIY